MTSQERRFLSIILLIIAVITLVDIISDYQEGTQWWHLVAEGVVALASTAGILYLIRDSFSLKHSLEEQKKSNVELKRESEAWREQSKKYVDGLSIAIDKQLVDWKLTASEKEVAFLLLKGFSLKEVAIARNTSDKTARAQSATIYAKAGVSGRSELSAFFLEDLLLPTNQNQ